MKAIDLIQLKFRGDGIAPTPTEVAALMQEFARIKCQDLLEIVAEKAKVEEIWEDFYVNKDSILKAVDLDKFLK